MPACIKPLAAFAGCLVLAVLFASGQQDDSQRILGVILVKSQTEAEAASARLKQGEDFEELARRISIDPTAGEGGYMGQVNVPDLRSELRDALKGLRPGEVTPPFRTPSGYMILKLFAASRESDSRKPSQLVAYVSGFEEALYAFSRLPKPDSYHQDLRKICELKTAAVESAFQEMQRRLQSPRSPQQTIQLYHTIAQLHAYQGSIQDAIRNFEEAFRLARDHQPGDLAAALQEKLAIAYLRKGEIDNCVANHNARSCIFPLTPVARHKLQDGSRRASSLFLDYLQSQPDDLEVKWLLNLALSTLGPVPKEVPAAHRLPTPAPVAGSGLGLFENVAHHAGLQRMNNAGGSILEDFDGDGHLDLVISVVNVCEPMSFYRNSGAGEFIDSSRAAGLSQQLGGININHADYNNDGHPDIFVMRGGWEFAMRNSLLKNDGKGTFTDVTEEAGLALPAYATPAAAWADFDNDGNIDLFIGNENAPGQLFRNRGDGTFVDVAPRAGLDRVSFTKSAVWGDFDNDAFPDLYVSNYEQNNLLYRNNRDGTFTEVARSLGVSGPVASFPAWFFDYDNDGCLDLFVSSYVQSVADVAAEYLGRPTGAESMKLYRNRCQGGFEDVTSKAGLARVSMAMGANFGDIDNDGYLDFYLGTGSPSYGALVPNLLFRNHDGRRFVDVTVETGTGHLQKGHGIAFGDIDRDGGQDIFLHTGGAVPGDVYSNVLFRNPGSANHWLSVRLSGRKSNRAAIGARIKAVIAEPGSEPRAVHRVVTSGGPFGSSSFAQHIGLGRARRVQSLEVWWPTSGERQLFRDIDADQSIEIVESQRSFRSLSRAETRGAGGHR